MDVARGERKARLPLAVIELALEMFAGSTGFSGPEIHRFFAEYDASIPDYAWGGGSPSRKELFRRFLQGFPVERQRQILVDACHYEGPMKYGRPSPKERRRLLTMLEGVHAPALQDVRTIAERLDWRWVLREWERAREQVRRDPAGAITAARSMLESVCKHVLGALDPTFDEKSHLPSMYRRVLEVLGKAPTGAEKAVRQIVSGCMSIVQGTAELRNELGDAHGRGPGKPDAMPRLAYLAVNAASTAALYVLQTFEAQHRVRASRI